MRAGLPVLAAATLLLSACATRPPLLPAVLPPGAPGLELGDTPFHPQDAYQCGPAALATVLQAAGVDMGPAALVDQVYVPDMQGSLQVEMLAATRRAGRIPYLIEPQPRALFAELAAGRPVLVLQNLGLRLLPVWHYAVVIGADSASDTVILRSGTERRRLSPVRFFLRSWELADNWAMVVLRPGDLPVDAERRRYLQATALAEPYLAPPARAEAYRAALRLWPEDATAQFGLAFAHQAAGDMAAAERAYLELIGSAPRHAAAYNNLAGVLAARGCYAAARRAAGRAAEIAAVDAPGLSETIDDTLQRIPTLPDGPACRQDVMPR
jgi:tetratricopeptide (TPR) repeat protein